MLKFVRQLFLIVAAALWLLHSVVPHVHDQHEAGISSTSQNAPSNFLLALFGTDLGNEHLEQFSLASQSFVAHEAQTIEIPAVACELIEQSVPVYRLSKSTPSQAQSHYRRGPPAA